MLIVLRYVIYRQLVAMVMAILGVGMMVQDGASMGRSFGNLLALMGLTGLVGLDLVLILFGVIRPRE